MTQPHAVLLLRPGEFALLPSASLQAQLSSEIPQAYGEGSSGSFWAPPATAVIRRMEPCPSTQVPCTVHTGGDHVLKQRPESLRQHAALAVTRALEIQHGHVWRHALQYTHTHIAHSQPGIHSSQRHSHVQVAVYMPQLACMDQAKSDASPA